jgi:hypothetical protein
MVGATIFQKAQDYFGLRLFQTFQEPASTFVGLRDDKTPREVGREA